MQLAQPSLGEKHSRELRVVTFGTATPFLLTAPLSFPDVGHCFKKAFGPFQPQPPKVLHTSTALFVAVPSPEADAFASIAFRLLHMYQMTSPRLDNEKRQHGFTDAGQACFDKVGDTVV